MRIRDMYLVICTMSRSASINVLGTSVYIYLVLRGAHAPLRGGHVLLMLLVLVAVVVVLAGVVVVVIVVVVLVVVVQVVVVKIS